MPRFYFDVLDGDSLARDDTGLEFPSLDAAEDEAARAIADIGRDTLPKRGGSELCVRVRDSSGRLALIVTLAMTTRRLDPAPL